MYVNLSNNFPILISYYYYYTAVHILVLEALVFSVTDVQKCVLLQHMMITVLRTVIRIFRKRKNPYIKFFFLLWPIFYLVNYRS